MGHIYCLLNKINGKRYIGKTIQDVRLRVSQHHRSYHYQSTINKALYKYGDENFFLQTWEIPDEQLDSAEKSIIKQLDTITPNGYNLTPGGDGVPKGFIPWHKGKSGRKQTKEIRDKISKTLTGFKRPPFTEEHRKNISLSGLGRPSCNRQKIVLIHPSGEEERFDSITQACKKYNLSQGTLSMVFRGERNQHKGFIVKPQEN